MAKTVLIVEDERLLARTLSSALKEAGYVAVVTHSVDQAQERWLGEDVFDLVILDNRLPKGTGLELLRAARESGRTSKVILMILKTPKMAPEEPMPIRKRPMIGRVKWVLKRRGKRPTTVSKIHPVITFLGPKRSSISPTGRCIKE